MTDFPNDHNGVGFRISGFGEKSVEAARQVSGSRIGTAHDRQSVDSGTSDMAIIDESTGHHSVNETDPTLKTQ